MARTGGNRSLKRAYYFEKRRVDCLINWIVSTLDGPIFALNGPKVERRHDLTLYREIN